MNWTRNEYTVSTEIDRIDFSVVYKYLNEVAYWSPGVERAKVEKAARHSLCFGLFEGNAQIGFARLITDRATFAYLSDVFVLPEFQGRGLGEWLMGCVFSHPDLADLRRIMLVTKDAHGFYEKFGFNALSNPEQVMEKLASARR